MSGAVLSDRRSSRHRDSPRTRRAARDAGVDLAAVRPTGAHGRATVADVAAAADGRAAGAVAPESVPPVASAAPAAPTVAVSAPAAMPPTGGLAAAAPSSSLLEVDVTAVLRRAAVAGGAPVRTHLLAEVVGSLARAASATRPPGLPEGPVAVHVVDDDGRTALLDGADLLSGGGVRSRLLGGAPPPPDVTAVLDVVGTAGSGTTVDVLPLRPGGLAVLAVGPALRRPVVVLGPDGDEQIGVRSVAWLALTGPDPTLTAALLARVGRDLAGSTAVAR